MTDWNTRDDVADELAEFHGWREDATRPGLLFSGGAMWNVIDADGTSHLSVATSGRPSYSIPFGPRVPSFLIVRACLEAAADCQACGTACGGDCREPDGALPGADGDGYLMSHHGL